MVVSIQSSGAAVHSIRRLSPHRSGGGGALKTKYFPHYGLRQCDTLGHGDIQ